MYAGSVVELAVDIWRFPSRRTDWPAFTRHEKRFSLGMYG